MKLTIAKKFFVALLLVGLNACSTHQNAPPSSKIAVAPQIDTACNVTAVSWSHIFNAHCHGGNNIHGNQFDPIYCTQSAQQTLCTEIQQNHTNRVVQATGRVCYDAPLNHAIGSAGENHGRLVITNAGNGTAITQFPVAAGQCPH
ncbi:hypothetical protein [Cellvibrio sp.]|jgi:hypothetical protein